MTRHSILSVIVAIALAITIVTFVAAMVSPSPQPQETVDPVTVALENQKKTIDELSERIESVEGRLAEVPAEDEPADDEPLPSVIERVAADGQDVADLLDLSIYKFQFRLPPERYTMFVWLERWMRDAQSPGVSLLSSNSSDWGEGNVVLKLPSLSDDLLFIRIGNSVESIPGSESVSPPPPVRIGTLDREPIVLQTPIHLVTMTHNLSERLIGGLKDVHRDHDQTVYIKAGFVVGSFMEFDRSMWVPDAAPDTAPPNGDAR